MASLIVLLVNLIQIYELMIIVRIIMTWIQVSPYNPILRFLSQFCDPLLDATRNAFPFLAAGGIDFSPMVVIFLLHITSNFMLSLA
jgi:YggT family protein